MNQQKPTSPPLLPVSTTFGDVKENIGKRGFLEGNTKMVIHSTIYIEVAGFSNLSNVILLYGYITALHPSPIVSNF